MEALPAKPGGAFSFSAGWRGGRDEFAAARDNGLRG
jgi:hypothetical protein